MKKNALITGASRGIGYSLAKTFAQNGYNLILTCINNIDKLTDICHELSAQYNITCKPVLCDMSNPDSVNELFDTITDLDILINNAGISYMGLLSDMSVNEWHHVIDTNLSSVFYTCKRAIPIMLNKKQGKIINISSVWGNVGASMEVAYSASKGGVNTLTKALAKELAPSNIQVNAIACGLIDTDMNKCLTDEELRAVIDEIPADRIGEPSDVAKLAITLCNTSNYLTGQIISLDGGWI